MTTAVILTDRWSTHITRRPQQVSVVAFATTSRADVARLEKPGNLSISDEDLPVTQPRCTLSWSQSGVTTAVWIPSFWIRQEWSRLHCSQRFARAHSRIQHSAPSYAPRLVTSAGATTCVCIDREVVGVDGILCAGLAFREVRDVEGAACRLNNLAERREVSALASDPRRDDRLFRWVPSDSRFHLSGFGIISTLHQTCLIELGTPWSVYSTRRNVSGLHDADLEWPSKRPSPLDFYPSTAPLFELLLSHAQFAMNVVAVTGARHH